MQHQDEIDFGLSVEEEEKSSMLRTFAIPSTGGADMMLDEGNNKTRRGG
jgi:hypothetical protein